MKLTPEQQEQVRQAKARGERRVTVSFTAEQRKAWRQAVEQELAGKDENIAHIRKVVAAAEQSGFFGDVRRAIILSRRLPNELCAAIGVNPSVLADFRAGDAELLATALEQLIETLGLRLMHEIPR
jgi:DNA-binding MarR family transcriptional regulator